MITLGLLYEPEPGEHLDTAIGHVLEHSKIVGEAWLMFNDIFVKVTSDMTAKEVHRKWAERYE